MAIVYILGAGASYGEQLSLRQGAAQGLAARLTPPPLVNGFFNAALYERLGYTAESASRDFREAFDYIRSLKHTNDAVGTGAWGTFDLEEIFTSIELERDFCDDQSDEYSALTLARNKLLRYIGRILALCTQGACGDHISHLANSLNREDSVITFNWDLLLDYELSPRGGKWHYRTFFETVLRDFSFNGDPNFGPDLRHGMLLKLHGSLNWYRCTNKGCRRFSDVVFYEDVSWALDRLMGIGPSICETCGSEMNPLLIAPLLKKPIKDESLFRSIWGVARRKLESATAVVVIGYSLPPTDFYSAWLLRSIQKHNPNARVFVVNPSNDPNHAEHAKFRQRMLAVFPGDYDATFTSFDQIEDIVRGIERP
jgi:hypothetical protein